MKFKLASVNVELGDSERAIYEMKRNGASTATLSDMLEQLGGLEKRDSLEEMEEEALRRAEKKKVGRIGTKSPYRKAHRSARKLDHQNETSIAPDYFALNLST